MNPKAFIIKNIVGFFAVCLLYSCTVTKPYQKPQASTDNLYRTGTNIISDTISIATMSWKEMFTDKPLQNLIEEGIQNNLDLKTAYSRIIQSKAYFDQIRLQFYPSVDANLGTTLDHYSNPKNAQQSKDFKKQFQYGFQASWEADIWGKLKSAKKSNLAAMFQEEANTKAVQTALVASITTDYYNLLALDQQLKITKESVKNWQKTVDVMQKLKTADVVTGAAVVQSEASKYALEASIPDIELSIWETENHLNRLLARNPQPIVRGDLNSQKEQSTLQTGIPAQLLANRPDVQAAEYNFRYYYEQTNVARTAFYPSLTLSASTGYQSYTSLFSLGSWVNALVGGLTQPVFNRGVNKAKLIVAEEAQKQAALNFQSVLLTAGQEVSNALYSYKTALDKQTSRKEQLLNLEKSVDYTQKLVRNDFANYTEVLIAQQSLLTGQLNQVNDRLQQLQAIVSLYRALGGGWK